MQIRLGEILRDEDTWPREQLDPHRVALFCELETRKGTCRLGPALARELAGLAPRLAEAVAPPAEQQTAQATTQSKRSGRRATHREGN